MLLSAGACVPPAHASATPSVALSCLPQGSSGRTPAQYQWTQHGSTVERRELPPAPGDASFLVQVEEQGVDVEIEIQDRAGVVIARSDSPVERSALQFVRVPANSAGSVLVVRAKEPAGLVGTVRVSWVAIDRPNASGTPNDCMGAVLQWAEADMAYARGRLLTLGRMTADAGSARAAFDAAARAYAAARSVLRGPANAYGQGLLELDLAALAYYGSKDWSGAASWGARAATTFAANHDAYRRARAQAIEAAAWIELATSATGAD